MVGTQKCDIFRWPSMSSDLPTDRGPCSTCRTPLLTSLSRENNTWSLDRGCRTSPVGRATILCDGIYTITAPAQSDIELTDSTRSPKHPAKLGCVPSPEFRPVPDRGQLMSLLGSGGA